MSSPTGHNDRQPANHRGGERKQHAASLVPLQLRARVVDGQEPTPQQTSKTS